MGVAVAVPLAFLFAVFVFSMVDSPLHAAFIAEAAGTTGTSAR